MADWLTKVHHLISWIFIHYWKERSMPLSIPTIVLTGATSGIGRCAAIALARQGANLVLTARSQARADATVAIIKAAAPSPRIHVHYGDFCNLTSVAALRRELVSSPSLIPPL